MRTVILVTLITLAASQDQLQFKMESPAIMTKYSDLTKYQQNSLLTTPQFDSCYPANMPHLYSGKISQTENGFTCQRWVKQSPHSHTFDGWSFNDGYFPENYCRVDVGDSFDSGRPWCYTTDKNEEWDYCPVPSCHPNIGFCVSKMPGLDGFSSGIDILEFDLFEISAGRKGVVFDFTCYYDWKDVFEGETYVQPDQVSFYTQKDKGSLSNNAEIIRTMADVKNTMGASVSAEASFGPVSGSLSTSYKQMEQTIKKGTYMITRTEGKEITAEARLVKAKELPLNSEFKEDMDALPSHINGSWNADEQEAFLRKYYDFIHKYGTHYISEALFGGMVRVESIVETTFLKTHTEKELSVAASLAYDGLVSASVKTEYSQSEKKLNEDFRKSSKTTSTYYGGDVNFSKDGISKWQQSVKNNPVMTNVRLVSLHELFYDWYKRLIMKSVIDLYITNRLECPPGWKKYNRKCFGIYGYPSKDNTLKGILEPESWQGASDKCKKMGAKLASINSAEEQKVLKQLGLDYARRYASKLGYQKYLGGMWLNAKDSVTEGTWVWQDTMQRVNWEHWGTGAKGPGSSPGKDCLSNWVGVDWDGETITSHISAERCDDERRFVCETTAGGVTFKQSDLAPKYA